MKAYHVVVLVHHVEVLVHPLGPVILASPTIHMVAKALVSYMSSWLG
jgi:hypothetical protein